MFPFYTLENTSKSKVFQVFSGGLKWEHWPTMGLDFLDVINIKSGNFVQKSPRNTFKKQLQHLQETPLYKYEISVHPQARLGISVFQGPIMSTVF